MLTGQHYAGLPVVDGRVLTHSFTDALRVGLVRVAGDQPEGPSTLTLILTSPLPDREVRPGALYYQPLCCAAAQVDVPFMFGSMGYEPDLGPGMNVSGYSLEAWAKLLDERFEEWGSDIRAEVGLSRG